MPASKRPARWQGKPLTLQIVHSRRTTIAANAARWELSYQGKILATSPFLTRSDAARRAFQRFLRAIKSAPVVEIEARRA